MRGFEASRGLALALALVLMLSSGGCAAQRPPAPAPAAVSGTPVAAEAMPVGDSVSGSYLAGRHAQRRNDWQAAATYLSRVLAARAEDEDLLRRTFVLALGAGDYERALALAPRVGPDAPEYQIANALRAVAAARAGDFAAALDPLEDQAEMGVHRFLGPLLRGWLSVGLDDPAAAERLASIREVDGFENLYFLHAGLIAELLGDPDAAVAALDQIDTGAMTMRMGLLAGAVLARAGRGDDAALLYSIAGIAPEAAERAASCLVCDPVDGMAEAFLDIAGALQRERLPELALVYGQLALYANPALDAARMLLGEILAGQLRFDQAEQLYAAVADESYLGWLARLRRAAMLERLERTDAAIDLLRAMVRDRPRRADASLQLGDLLRRLDRFGEAVTAYREGLRRIEQEGPEHWAVYYALGIAYERSGRWEQAEGALLRALELNPDQPYVLNYLGYTWADQNVKMDQARDMIERAVDQRPEDGYIVDSLGWVYYRMGDFDNAVRTLERAVLLVPDDPTINDHLGDAYWQVGREAEARFQWQRALNYLAPDDALDPDLLARKIRRGLPGVRAANAGR